MIGVICNVLAVALGGAAGAVFGNRLSDNFVSSLNSIFGICALGMGISSIILMENMPAVILSLIAGTAIGLMIHLGDRISGCGRILERLLAKKEGGCTGEPEMAASGLEGPDTAVSGRGGRTLDISLFVTAAVLFCSSGTGIYGCLDAGMTGNVTILLSKSILDFFTAMIFACSLGVITSVIAVPQLIIFLLLFLLARVIYPLTTPVMISDFKACGGFILLATGLRIAKIRDFPIADMIPAMLLVMPVSALWANCILPLL